MGMATDGTGSHFHTWWMRLTLSVFQRGLSFVATGKIHGQAERGHQRRRNILIIEKGMNRKLIGIALAIAGLARSQPQLTTRPKFDVTSVKPNLTNCCVTFGVGNGGSRNRDVTLKMLIGTAYRVQDFQISGGPGWIASDRFDV